MTPRGGFTLFRSLLNFLCSFQLLWKRLGWRFLARGRASLNLKWIYDEISYCETKNDFSKKIMSIRSCTCSSNLTDFLLIWQEFVFFTKSGRKGLKYPSWEIVHVMWSSIFEKWGGTILKLLFGGCFTKLLVLGTQKMENVFRCNEMENFLLQHCLSSQDAHVCPIWEHYHKLCYDSSHNIGHLARKSWNIEHDSPFWEGIFEIFAIFHVWYFLL